MEYAELVAFFERLEATTKRLEMTAILVEMLEQADAAEMTPIVRLMQGKVAPDWEGIELGLAEKMVLQVLGKAAGLNMKADGLQQATTAYHDAGDLGEAAKALMAKKGGARQVGLMAFGAPEQKTLGVAEVFARLRAIADVSGAGSQDEKQSLLSSLLADVSPTEAKFIIRTVTGRSRLGVAELTFLEALAAWHVGKGVRSVTEMEPEERAEHERVKAVLEHGYDVRSDLAVVAQSLADDGLAAVAGLGVEHGTPLRPMAAERLKTIPEILEKHAGRSAAEYKYDGLRLQCHVTPDSVRLFSRRLEDLTDQFPDAQRMLQEAFQGRSAIVEGEVVAWDPDAGEHGRMRPFQDISRRRGRKTGLGEDARTENALAEGGAQATTMMDEVPVKVFLFDCMALDGEAIMDRPYQERRERMMTAFPETPHVAASTMEVCDDAAALETFFLQAVDDGAEGVMCKALDAPYKAGNRGFDWIKYKTDYNAELVDTMDLVVIGAFRGRGRRAGWYGALLMAAYEPDSDTYQSVCKLGTGFDDATLMGLADRFAPHLSQERPGNVQSEMVPDVWFHPATVMEVQAFELTLSPTHRAGWGAIKDGAGLAARFPRFSGRWRDDKAPEQATSVDELLSMYGQQGS